MCLFLTGCALGTNSEPPIYGNMDIVPVTTEEDLTPNKIDTEIIGDEDKTIVEPTEPSEGDEQLPPSSSTGNNKGETAPTQDPSKPTTSQPQKPVGEGEMSNNTTGDSEPSVTMD